MNILNTLNHLKIRTKLIVYLTIPILTILFFAISGIYTKTQELQGIKNTHKFMTVSLHLADLVHELQKERGLNAGFVGSSGKNFIDEMQKQQKLTNERLSQFNQNLNINSPDEKYWGLTDKFTILRNELSRLPGVRSSITTLKEGDFFEYYSSLNAHAIDIIQYLKVLTNDAPLARQSDAFALLLRLQERTGQERGALNGVFASGKLDAKSFQEISAYVADQTSILNNYYTVVSNKYQDLLRKKLNHPIVLEVEDLRAAAINKSRRDELLNDLQMMIGYGGLIHDFKNYIIRGREWYVKHYSEISLTAKNIIEQYENLPGMGPQGINDLKIIDTTFEQYHTMLNDAVKMKELGHSIIEIDKLNKIDDDSAINAIKNLRKDITSSDTNKWWEIATFKIELIKDISDAIRSDMVSHNEQSMSTITQSAILYVLLSIFSITVTLVLGFLLMQRLVDELASISINMRRMQKKNNFNQRLKVNGHDEISDVAESFNDLINEREQHEEQLRRSQKMDALGKLTGGIAHDYNNMLGVIMGYASILECELKNQPKLGEYAKKITYASKRNAELTKKLLGFSSPKAGDAILLDINKLLHDEQNMLEKLLTARIQLVLNLQEDLWPVWLDYGDLEDAIINLCINAMHATDGNGQLTIKTSNEQISPSDAQLLNLDTGDYITLSIADTGCGMDEDTIEEIFNPFYSTKGDEGTGMGLSQVYGFVKRSDSWIKVHSKPDFGSQFIFYFPRHQVSSDSHCEIKQNNNGTDFKGRETILIVDDEPALRELAYEVLSQRGYKIICAENGKKAQNILKNESIDLIITDIIMPELNGYQLASFVQEKYPTVKIQLTSGYDNAHEIDNIGGNLKQNLLHKPYSPQTLLKRVRERLDEQ